MDGQTGFQPQNQGFSSGFSQGGFQNQIGLLLTDMNALKQNLQSAQWQIQSAITLFQQAEFQPSYWTGGNAPTSENQGFTPADQQRVTVMENDLAAIRNSVLGAKSAVDQAASVVGKPDFQPGQFSQGGFTENR